MDQQDEEWERIWAGIDELSEVFEDRLVYIGGIAVFLHVDSEKSVPAGFVEYSHDADLFISLADFSGLRDIEDVIPNRRLHKYQVIKHGIDFDVYLERQSKLLVSYEDLFRASESVTPGGRVRHADIRIASVEHLLLLKLDAYLDRQGSAKGYKDERDLIRLVYLLRRGVDQSLLAPYLTDRMVEELRSVENSTQFSAMSGGNAHQTRRLKSVFQASVENIARSLGRRR